MLERVKPFANEMLGRDEESDGKNSDTDSESQEKQTENVTGPAFTDYEELMRNIKSVATSTCADLLQTVLRTSMCLSRENRQGKHQGRYE